MRSTIQINSGFIQGIFILKKTKMILENINKGVFDAPELKDRPLRRFFRLLSIDKKDLYRVYILAIASGLISLSLPLAIQAIIGQIMAAQISTSLYVLIGAVTIATFFSGAFQVMQFRIIEDIQRRIFTRTSFEFALKIPRFKVENIISDYPPEMINPELSLESKIAFFRAFLSSSISLTTG
jgi:ABC-type bacteriocin/lantibiotic exporter with double-glycine peptidase domain